MIFARFKTKYKWKEGFQNNYNMFLHAYFQDFEFTIKVLGLTRIRGQIVNLHLAYEWNCRN
jgi:hypothetical protein